MDLGAGSRTGGTHGCLLPRLTLTHFPLSHQINPGGVYGRRGGIVWIRRVYAVLDSGVPRIETRLPLVLVCVRCGAFTSGLTRIVSSLPIVLARV